MVPAPNPGEPDLVVTEISWLPEGPEAGDEIAMQATIMNQGTGLTPDSVVHGVLFTTDSAGMSQGVWSDNHTAPIAPGESVTVTANGGSQGSTWTAVEGTHTITARVDDQNRIAESDEDNNLLTGAMTVETSAPIDPASGADANPTGNAIGGGSGYSEIISRNDPRVKYVVNSRSTLLSALQNARSGDVVYVEGNANIDLTGSFDVQIPAGVTLASNRGENGAPGGRIYQNRLSNDPTSGNPITMLRTAGQHVRITGLRIEGPDKTTSWPGAVRCGIFSPYRNLEVDNCEISGWSHAGVHLRATGGSTMIAGGHIHHNSIHRCQTDGFGYGALVSGGAQALIEANYFDYTRHAVAGSGVAGDGYEVRYNRFGPNHIASSAFQVDMHGEAVSGTYWAGTLMSIHHNTFECLGPWHANPIRIRGIPRDHCYI
ncbi:MAG: CARDB domain-containing protein, partial [Methanomicrobiaceae archaeon]|nr:CARDB domain-containing protein [Methanomicrobiaceae archaeon]